MAFIDYGVSLSPSLLALPLRQAKKAQKIVEADETFILKSFKGRWSDLPRKARKRAGRPGMLASFNNIPISRSRLARRDLRRGPAEDDSASIEAALAGVMPAKIISSATAEGDRCFRRKAEIPFHAVLAPGSSTAEAPTAHQQRQRLSRRCKKWLNRFNGVATKNCQLSRWRAPSSLAIKPRRKADQRNRNAHINSYRYKRRICCGKSEIRVSLTPEQLRVSAWFGRSLASHRLLTPGKRHKRISSSRIPHKSLISLDSDGKIQGNPRESKRFWRALFRAKPRAAKTIQTRRLDPTPPVALASRPAFA